MKSINECSAEERMIRALVAIETMSVDLSDENPILSAIYKIAHVALGHCPHPDWLQEIEEFEKVAVEHNLYHIDRVLRMCDVREQKNECLICGDAVSSIAATEQPRSRVLGIDQQEWSDEVEQHPVGHPHTRGSPYEPTTVELPPKIPPAAKRLRRGPYNL